MNPPSRILRRLGLLGACLATTGTAPAVDVMTGTGAGLDGTLYEVDYTGAYSGNFDTTTFRNFVYRATTPRHMMAVLKFDFSALGLNSANINNASFTLTAHSSSDASRARNVAVFQGDDSQITPAMRYAGGFNPANPAAGGCPFIDPAYTPETDIDLDFAAGTLLDVGTLASGDNLSKDVFGSGNAAFLSAVKAAADDDGIITVVIYGGNTQYLFYSDNEADVTRRPKLSLFGDTDNDGLDDDWEILHFGSITFTNDGNADLDTLDGTIGGTVVGDGYTNEQEETAGSSPLNRFSVPGDIDADGLNDLWEDKYFGNNDGVPTLAELALQNGSGDPDGDGFTNEQEESGLPVPSNPTNAKSVPGNSDGDTLDDSWEISNFGAIETQNGLHDSDGDLYNNEEEETAGTDPLDIYDFIDDVDADAQNDRWEIRYFGSTGVSNNAFGDPDGDGFENDWEYTDGSNPNNIASTPDDVDGDGLEDFFELTFFPNIWDYDGDDDPDRDFATNAQEAAAGTNPTLRTSSPDSDGDTLGDAWEIYSFGNLTATNTGTDDNDGDGVNNSAEYAAASNGNDPLSGPDADNDGLADVYEIATWGSTTTQTGWDDSDGGGVSNLLERRLGTNPTVAGDDAVPTSLTTAAGNGADTFITNDGNTGPNVIHGANNGLTVRVNYGVRIRVPIIRFDVSSLAGDLTGTMLRLDMTGASPRSRTWQVWGLVDGDSGENWSEATTNYPTAPGLRPADLADGALNQFVRDPKRLRLLGTLSIYQNQIGTVVSNPATLDLKSFIEADTDGLVTLMLSNGDENFEWYMRSKEGATAAANPVLAPTLIVPNGTIVTPSSPRIVSTALNSVTDTFTMSVAGLSSGQQYHVEWLIPPAALFSDMAGSTFTASSDPQSVVVPVDKDTTPAALFRVDEGAAAP